jgi:hypothetical protein
MRPTLDDEWDLEPWADDPDGVDAHYIRESNEPEPDPVVRIRLQSRPPESRRPTGTSESDWPNRPGVADQLAGDCRTSPDGGQRAVSRCREYFPYSFKSRLRRLAEACPRFTAGRAA